ncbi:MAG: 2-hydroxyacid dehydrogenase [Gammaproteobacteria bacterium]
MSKPKVIVTRRWPEAVEKHMQELFDVQLNTDDIPMTADELAKAFQTADAVCPTVSDKISADVINVDNMKARVIGNFGVGFNHIDVEAAKSNDLVVTNTPEVLTDCTADTAMTLMLMTARRAGEGERHVRTKAWTGWRPTHMMGTKVTGKKLGLIGFGRIAQAMAHKSHFGFGMKIYFYDPYPPSEEVINKYGAIQCDTVEEVLSQVDFVTLHCPGGGSNTNLMNAERLSLMKSDAILINTARGDVVDEPALVDALNKGTIAAAGLDVFAKEPQVTEALLTMDNVVLLPHLGSATLDTRVAMGMRVVENLSAFFAGEPPRDRVV